MKDCFRYPGSRLERKIQQLDNVGRAVMECAVDGDVIVDFCSGGGHLGLVLAQVLLLLCSQLLLPIRLLYSNLSAIKTS